MLKKEKTTKSFNNQVTIPTLLAAGGRGDEPPSKGCHCQTARDYCPRDVLAELLG